MERDKIRILFLINKLKRGGAERVFINQINFLQSEGFQIYLGIVFSSVLIDNYSIDLKIDKTRINNFGFKNIFDIRAYLHFSRFIKQKEITTIYSTLEVSNIIARILKLFFPALKVLIRESGMACRKTIIIKALDLFLNFWTDRIIAVSSAAKDSLVKYQKVHAKKIIILENAVAIDSWEKVAAEREKTREETDCHFRILNIGSMDSVNKGQEGLIDIFCRLQISGQISGAQLVLVGDGVLRPHLEEKVRQNQLEDKILFMGQINTEAVKQQYFLSDIFVLNSQSEGFPNTVLEAMSFGLPIVSTRVGGVTELIEDGQSGFLVDIGDRINLEKMILELWKDKARRLQMGRNAWQRVKNSYSFESQMNKLMDLFYKSI